MNKTTWIEIKLSIPAAEVDAVANFLIEHGSNGIVEESHSLSPAQVPEEDQVILKAYLKNDVNINSCINNLTNYLESLYALNKKTGRPELSIREIEDEDWNEKWKSFFEPIKVTKHIVIKPSWRNYWRQESEIVIEIDPGMAFGTGTHASTRLCLLAIEELAGKLHDIDASSLLDVGTGSGILALAASLLGIKQVKGIDIDHQAVACAKKNAAINSVSEEVVFTSTPLGKLNGRFSIIVANILPQTLIDMKDDLINHLSPSGYLILSGILNEKATEVIDAFRKDISFIKEMKEGEWSCLIFKIRK